MAGDDTKFRLQRQRDSGCCAAEGLLVRRMNAVAGILPQRSRKRHRQSLSRRLWSPCPHRTHPSPETMNKTGTLEDGKRGGGQPTPPVSRRDDLQRHDGPLAGSASQPDVSVA